MTTDDKYSRRNMLNFTQQLEALLSQKQKTFSVLFLAFLKYALNLEDLERKDEYPSLVISRIIDSEIGGNLTSKRSCFRTPFGSQCVTGFQTRLK